MKQRPFIYLLNSSLLCLLFLTAILSGGCSGTPNYVSDTRQFSGTITKQLDSEYQVGDQKDLEVVNAQNQLSFTQAYLLAAQNDKKIAAILAEIDKANIDIDGAKSYRLPRFKLSADTDLPISSSDDAESELTGGVYVDYDIWRAVAVKDETVLRQALEEKSLHQLRLSLNALQKTLIKHLNRLAFLEYKTKKKQQALELALNARALAKIYTQNQRVGPEVLVGWESRIETLEVELENNGQELVAERYAVADLLGQNVTQQVTISDTEGILEQQQSTSNDTSSPSEVWTKHSEARLYELDLIAAEVAMSLVRLERLPKINASLGLGSIPLNNDLDTASSVVHFSLSMPLLDMGDYQRKFAKSRINRDRVKREMRLNATRLWNRMQVAKSVYEMTEQKLNRLDQSVAKAHERIKQKSILVEQTKIDNLSVLLDKINMVDLEILHQEAQITLRGAADDLRFAAGDDIVADSVDKIIETL